jgi:alpha-soluble NSF attachment protein
VSQADKALASVSKGFSFFGGGKEQKYQDASDLYIRAANAFKIQGASQW